MMSSHRKKSDQKYWDDHKWWWLELIPKLWSSSHLLIVDLLARSHVQTKPVTSGTMIMSSGFRGYLVFRSSCRL
jgi:hypothetical protein